MNKYEYHLERTDRKTVQLKICSDGSLLIRAPQRYPVREIERLIEQHESWIEKHRSMIEKRVEREQMYAGTPEQIEALYQKAREILPQKVAHYARLMDVMPTGIRITSAEKRFGSCSGKNSLCFSYRLMMYPEKAIDYVVVHELAHIRHHDHSAAFYAFVASVLPDYKQREALLKDKLS